MAKLIRNKPFKSWLYEDVMNEFELIQLKNHAFLEHIEKIKLADNDLRRPVIESMKSMLLDYVDSWNNDEHKLMFVGPFLYEAKFVSQKFNLFAQRKLSIKYEQGTKITEGLVELMLAKGIQIPRKPFNFFLQQYKAEKRDNDPLGQLLISMVAAKVKNEDDKPIYGIYVNGRNWFFVILENNTYAVSNPFVATSDDIFDLFAVLLYFKDLMEKLYSEN